MEPQPYSFHCTPCGNSHAGECPKPYESEGEKLLIECMKNSPPTFYGISVIPWLPGAKPIQTWQDGTVTKIDHKRREITIALKDTGVFGLGQIVEVDRDVTN